MEKMIGMLQEITFFAGNGTDTGLNHAKIQAAYTFLRVNMADLVEGKMDVSLAKELTTLE